MYPPLFFPTLQMGKNNVPPHSFSPPYRWGKTVYPHTLFPHLTDGEKQCTPPLFFPTLQMERKSELHSFSPSIRWKFENVPHTLFSHCNKMGKKSVPPTLFFPIIEGEKVQRVRNFTEPFIHGHFVSVSNRHCMEMVWAAVVYIVFTLYVRAEWELNSL